LESKKRSNLVVMEKIEKKEKRKEKAQEVRGGRNKGI
jgi:hypothetical protein